MSAENGNILDLGSMDFTPDWAKKDAGVKIAHIRPVRDDYAGQKSEAGGQRKSFGDRKPFGERRGFGDRKPFGERKGADDRKPFAKKPFDRRPRFEDRPRPLEVDVKILPETKALGTIIRKLQNDTHAYKLKDLAYFFLDNPSSVLLKITPRIPQGGLSSPSPSPFAFFQCKACGFASTREEDVIEHAVSAHLGDYYDSKEVDCEPPKGNFNCVAKCGLSGVLLGPPNIHEFNAVVKEMVRTRYPDMSEEQYRAHIEMVREADAIEEWRKGATKKTLFYAKGTADQEGAQGFSREQVEGEFKRNILASLVDRPKTLMITAEMAMKSPVRPLQWAARDAVEQERRAPYNMCFALRGAFHHRKMKFFRVNDAHGQEFVSNVEYKEFDAEHAIAELAAAAKFIAEHPCCDKGEFPAEADFEKHLAWLVTTGHVVAFTNGVYSAVEKFPKYGPQWKKRSAAPTAQAKAKTEGEGEGEGEGEEVKVESVPVATESEEPKANGDVVPQPAEAETPPSPPSSEPEAKDEAPAESNNQTIEESNNETSPVVAE